MGKEKDLIVRELVYLELEEQLDFFLENFSLAYALRFAEEFVGELTKIRLLYDIYPECRFLPTQKRIYRNISWGNYLIIYKIKSQSIEVLSLFHTKRNPSQLKRLRKMK